MARTVEGQAVPGGLAKFAVDNSTIASGDIVLLKPIWGPDGTLNYVDDATGLRFPVKAVSTDTSDAEVKTGDASLNADRVTIVGGAAVTELGVDNAPYAIGVDGGVPQHFIYQQTATLATNGARAAARMSPYRLVHFTGPPRQNQVQGFQALQTTAEVTILAAGAAGVYHDLSFIAIYTDTITAPTTTCIKVQFRDATGATFRPIIPVAEKGGSNAPFGTGGVRWNQTTAANPWLVSLSVAAPTTPVQSTVYVHVVAEVRRD